MTQNQVAFYKAREDARHNVEQEKIGKMQNKINRQHLKRQDEYTSAHYERSDTAGMISANASAMNAQAAATNAATNRKNYEMQYDIEYNWTQQPLRYDEMQMPDGSTTIVYNYPKGMPLSAQVKDAQAMTALYGAVYEPTRQEYEKAEKVSNVLNRGSGSVQNIFNALFGKQGLYGALESIIAE